MQTHDTAANCMIYIGNHLSSSSGFAAMGRKAMKLGGDTFAFFTRNPRGGKAKEIDPEDIGRLSVILQEHHFGPLVAHAPYTMNLCSDKESIRQFSRDILKDDLQRMEYLPGNYYNFHPGSHVGQGAETGIKQIAEALDEAMFSDMKTKVLLETMSGKGSEIGGRFQELQQIICSVRYPERLGVCLDTCHIWDSGYDIGKNLDEVLEEFDQTIGLERLYAIHLNDSKNKLASHKDRHECLGEGYIGTEILQSVIRHPKLQGKPFILETPNEDEGYAKEIAWVRSIMLK